NRHLIRSFVTASLFQSNCKAEKNICFYLVVRAEQRIISPLLLSFDCRRAHLRSVAFTSGRVVCLHLDEPNNSTAANGSADHGRNRFSVNFVLSPGLTSTRT